MASGLPDWKLSLNIEGQEDGYLKQRPGYGAAAFAAHAANVAAGAITSILSVSGTGMIYTGFITVASNISHKDDGPDLFIDGSQVATTPFDLLAERGLSGLQGYVMRLLHFDDVNFIYTTGLTYGLTFESSFELKYDNQEAAVVMVISNILYALVT